ncbi:hypothetical protein [Marinobacter sp.]|uniref:hypothetical protein n=1 Tax=Marinobacter sp. TaxID=50741 RepID=UPI002B277B30|nr:hypothetical protein [Marinobacter sp.]
MIVPLMPSYAFRAVACLLFVVVFLVYFPGFDGPFLFDDYPNLSQLASVGGVNDWESFLAFVLGGFSGPTGRPVSLMSFLVNTTNWPADPYGFKVVNVFVHTLNGLLIFLVTRSLLVVAGSEKATGRRFSWLALFCAAVWLLHPYLTSTTLYVVQRMAMLSALFCLWGMYLYLKGRQLVARGSSRGVVLMFLGVGLSTVLAVFSKENGAVLPSLILIYELTLGAKSPIDSRVFGAFKVIALVLPSIALLLYLSQIAYRNGFFVSYGSRDFSPYERLLTQSRVIFSYLESWFIPSFSGGRLFYDDFEVSRSWLSPRTTLVSVIAMCTLVLLAVLCRKRFPFFSFAFLFFLGSQLIESTTVGLEIKFDHRVYLGSAFLSLPFAVFAYERLSPRLNKVMVGTVLVVLSAATCSASSLWGSYEQMTLVWAAKQPMSVRAQTEAAQMQFNSGRPEASLQILDAASERMPNNFRLRLTQALVQCRRGVSPRNAMLRVVDAAKLAPYSHRDFGLLGSFFKGAIQSECVGISLEDFIAVVDELMRSAPDFTPRTMIYSQLHYYYGLALLRGGYFGLAQTHFDESLESRASLHIRMNIAANKASVGLHREAWKEAVSVRDRLVSGEVKGKELAEAPRLEDVLNFIGVVEKEMSAQVE